MGIALEEHIIVGDGSYYAIIGKFKGSI